jgi:sulfur carrier protein ThiS adenylyltransferase
MLVDVVLEQFPQKTLVAASGMAGFGSGNAIRTRKVTGRFYLCGDGKSDVDQDIGLTAPRVMLCAAHQALTVIRLILGEKDV